MSRCLILSAMMLCIFAECVLADVDNPSISKINVMESGAVGDGESDDTDAINRALASVSGQQAVVILPEGFSFKLTDQLNVPEGVAVHAYGATLEWDSVNRTPLDTSAPPEAFAATGNGIRLSSNSSWLGGKLIFSNVEQPPGDMSLSGAFWNLFAIGHFNSRTTKSIEKYTENVVIKDVSHDVVKGIRYGGIIICGASKNIHLSNIRISHTGEVENAINGVYYDNAANIEATWGGADGITYHPHDITMDNIVMEGYADPGRNTRIRGVHLAGAYNVTARKIRILDCKYPYSVYVGDPGDPGGRGEQGAVPTGGVVNDDQVGLINTNIIVDGLYAENFDIGFRITGDAHGSTHYERMSHNIDAKLVNSILIGQGTVRGEGNWNSNIGVYISDAEGCEISDCTIMRCAEGINLRTPQPHKDYLAPRDLKIVRNQISQIEQCGIKLPTTVGALIKSNKISHCGTRDNATVDDAAIWIAGQNNRIENNQLGAADDQTTRIGIFVGLGDSKKCQPGNNILKDNRIHPSITADYDGVPGQFKVER